MKNLLLWGTTLTLLLVTSEKLAAQELNKAHKDSLLAIVDQYYNLNLKVFKGSSKPSDIDAIFSLFTNDFTYVHPKYGGEYSRENLYKGYINNQKKGNYNGKVADIVIVNKIVGYNAVAVQKRFINKTDNTTKEGELEMTLFEFKKGKISRIFEYW